MDIIISPGKLRGVLQAIPSKSQAHRLLICAALAKQPTAIVCPQTNADIEATAECLNALGACIQRNTDGYRVTPISAVPEKAVLNCRESGSTLRFLLPVAGALGVDATFHLSGRLPQRPLSPLWEEMERMGCLLSRPTEDTVRCTGKLQPGNYSITGNVSSQFISGLHFAISLLPGSSLNIVGSQESAPYVDMTLDAIALFENHPKEEIQVEGDWSNGAFFLTAAALGNDVIVNGLCQNSRQGDRAVTSLLPQLKENCTIDAKDIPDLVPILAVMAGANKGATFENISRLRLKESDRVASVIALLEKLGAKATATENTLTVHPATYHSCTVDSFGDHRIAMAAAIAATVATGPITLLGAECVCKSYPSFWEEFRKLGGNYEQYIR
jgi:3-phosphoshikimate 1-carboxyvinyltransferase